MLRTPDLRGKFLRGLNAIYAPGQPPFNNWDTIGDPDGAKRTVTDYQSDLVKTHSHTYNHFDNHIIKDASDDKDHRLFSLGDSADVQTADYGGSETRPRNIAVYYYVKINDGSPLKGEVMNVGGE